MACVENFKLDYNIVKTSYVRLAGTEQNGDALVKKYDLRFLRLNKDVLPTDALYTLEHSLVANIRDELKGIIGISLIGCRTGPYMTMWDQYSPQEIHDALVSVLNKVINTKVAPAASAKEYGNYRDHSLFAAREYAEIVLDQGISLDPFERIL